MSGTTTNVGINGFGRVGRQALRASLASTDLRVVAINDPFMDAEAAAHAIRFDTAAGRFRGSVEVKGRDVVVDGRRIAFTSVADPASIPWAEHDVAYVLECSGVYTTAERAASHLAGGAQRVVIGTVSADAPAVVLGGNEETFKPTTQVMAASSDIAVALCPVLKALGANFGGVEQCTYTCLHAATSASKATDCTNSKDPRGARAAIGCVAPLSVAADVKAIGRVLPRLAGRVSGTTVRVPTTVGSMLDVVVTLKEPTSLGSIARALDGFAVATPAADQASAPASLNATATTTPTADQASAPASLNATATSPPRSQTTTADDAASPSSPVSAAAAQPASPKAKGAVKILGVTRDPVVSCDFAGESLSAVLDVTASIALPPVPGTDGAPTSPSAPSALSNGGAPEDQSNCRTFKLVLWFDNERGYAQRMLDVVAHTSRLV
eukprot:CAMPEP_0174878910 /NCGR_PEP_ID=MMETSP1114-20130205/82995_1 /TAXON_ID=312471 /ORGANISM="Neobodo designis, Strain CCAP 1951/1" /LENGTH=438 /DNA_ID=CAMNT_0016114299 /DNA_START=27 /DNA_END=1343 /DNA_ORIENTATION=+